jgi:hypothetical protein
MTLTKGLKRKSKTHIINSQHMGMAGASKFSPAAEAEFAVLEHTEH